MRNNKIFKHIALTTLIAFSAVGCMDDDQDYPAADKPEITLGTSNVTVTEGDTGFITLNLSRAIGSEIDLKMEAVSGNATVDDYSVTAAKEFTSADDGVGSFPAYNIVIPTGVDTFDIPVSAIDDISVEGDETTTFRITSTGNGKAFLGEDGILATVTFANNESTDFYFGVSWTGTYTDADGDAHDYCDYDLDLELYDTAFNTLGTSYSSCPEEIRFPAGALPDGDYYLVPSFYTNAGPVPPAEGQTAIPAMITFSKPGVFVETIDLSNIWDTTEGGVAEGNSDGYLVRYLLTISGTTYTVTNVETGAVIAQG